VSTRCFGGVSRSLSGAALLLAACGGESARHGAPSSASAATSGVSTTAGESGADGTSIGQGGALSSDAGGNGAVGGDGTGGGTGGSSNKDGGAANGGSMPDSACAHVTCPGIPTSCKRIVQEPDACCPTCLDTGCDVCPPLDCAEGTHSETEPGDCCPSCVTDPPDACTTGQQDYAEVRAALLDKYTSSGCSNSSGCTLVFEHNACHVACNVALPVVSAVSFTSNLDARGPNCATCPAPAELDCAAEVAACVNGRCVAVDAADK
jgi:hypothetical protein